MGTGARGGAGGVAQRILANNSHLGVTGQTFVFGRALPLMFVVWFSMSYEIAR